MATKATTQRQLLLALRRAGVPADEMDGDAGGLVIDGVLVRLDVRRFGIMTPSVVRGLGTPDPDVVGVVVADRISDAARQELAAMGWGWLDHRGHVRIWTEGLRVSSGFEPLARAAESSRFTSVFPPVGVEVALALLKSPHREWSVTDLAASIGRAGGGVSERLRALRNAGLADRRNRPVIPELFWELVAPWHQRSHGVAHFPPLDDVTGRAFDDLSWLGLPADWVLTDTRAALALGAPLASAADGPPDFYLPQPSVVDLAIAHLGPARGQPAATVRSVRFAGIYEDEPFRRTAGGFRVAHPVVVALDLAQDRARGREIVDAWDPAGLGVIRVW